MKTPFFATVLLPTLISLPSCVGADLDPTTSDEDLAEAADAVVQGTTEPTTSTRGWCR
jgi:hypothetical protein